MAVDDLGGRVKEKKDDWEIKEQLLYMCQYGAKMVLYLMIGYMIQYLYGRPREST